MGKLTIWNLEQIPNCVRMPIKPIILLLSKTVYGKGMGDQPWNTGLCGADSFITVNRVKNSPKNMQIYVSKLEIFFHNSKKTKDLNFNSNILPLEQGFFNSGAEGFLFFILLWLSSGQIFSFPEMGSSNQKAGPANLGLTYSMYRRWNTIIFFIISFRNKTQLYIIPMIP